MTDATAEAPEPPAKAGKKPVIIGLVLALAGAGGGYFAASSGLLPLGGAAAASGHEAAGRDAGGHVEDGGNSVPAALPDIAFVPLDPIIVSLNLSNEIQHLRFRGQLEVESAYRHEVELILPRVTDVLNGYLRALEVSDLGDPMALTRLRAQMLRRIQIVAGKDRVRDLLIMDFVLN